MNVLFILPEFEPHLGGGICTYYRELLFQNKHWTSTVLQGSAVDVRDGASVWNEIPVHYLQQQLFQENREKFHHLSFFPELQNHLAAAWAMYEQAASLGKFDLIICTDWGLGFLPWVIKNNTPVTVHLHGSCGQIDHYDPRPGLTFWSKLYLHIEASIMERANALVTHSEQNIVFWEKRFTTSKRIALIPPAISMVEEQTKKMSDTIHGLVIARIQYWKGPILLCQAIAALEENDRARLKIHWIGRDTYFDQEQLPMSEYLKAHFPEIWGKIIIPLGSKDRDGINEALQSASWGLVPSVWDMFNLSAIEHLANKNPLLCSTMAGAADFLSDCPGCLLFESTPADLTEKLRQIIHTPEEEKSTLGEAAYQKAKALFHPDRIRDLHLQQWEKLLLEASNSPTNESDDWLMPSELPFRKKHDPIRTLTGFWPIKKIANLLKDRLLGKLR